MSTTVIIGVAVLVVVVLAAIIAISRRKSMPIEPVFAMLDSTSLDQQLGACQALIALRDRISGRETPLDPNERPPHY